MAEESTREKNPKKTAGTKRELRKENRKAAAKRSADVERLQERQMAKRRKLEQEKQEHIRKRAAHVDQMAGDSDLEKRKKEFEEKEKSVARELLEMLIYIGVVVVATFLVITYVGQRTHVSGASMEPALSNNDNLIVDKITYRFKEPERFDIIVFPFQYEEDTYYVKRIIGLPGETIQIIDGSIYIDGEVLRESYGREVMESAGIAADPITLGDDEYFVLGDNRNKSSDSRDPSVGNIKRDDIVGRAWLRIWPLNKFGILKHQ